MLNARIVLVMLALVASCDKDKKKDAPKPDPVAASPTPSATPTPSPSASPSEKPTESKPDPMAGWTERKGDGFSVIAPQDPKVDKKDLPIPGGGSLPATLYTHYVPEGPGAIQVLYADLDPKAKLDTKAMFDAMKQSMLTQFSAKITKEQEVKVGDAKGQEFWVEGEHPQMGKMKVHVKFLLAKRRLYLIQSLHSADAVDFETQGEKFVDSFKLI